MARSNTDADSGTNPTDPTFEPGELAADREKTEVVLVLEVYDQKADEFTIPALAGRTVAECASNDGYPADDPVVEVVYVSSLNFRLSERRGIDWTPEKILGMHRGNNLSRYNLRSYSLPASRLREIDT